MAAGDRQTRSCPNGVESHGRLSDILKKKKRGAAKKKREQNGKELNTANEKENSPPTEKLWKSPNSKLPDLPSSKKDPFSPLMPTPKSSPAFARQTFKNVRFEEEKTTTVKKEKDTSGNTQLQSGPNTKFVPFALPLKEAKDDTVIEEYTAIHHKLQHPLMHYTDDQHQCLLNEWNFPRMSNHPTILDWFDGENFKSLDRNPDHVNDMSKLYAGDAILDLCTKWQFRGFYHLSKLYAPPARLYGLILRAKALKKGDEKKKEVDLALNSCLSPVLSNNSETGFFAKPVVEVVIYHGWHFSKAFIANAGKVANREMWHPDKKETDAAPCILYCNSLDNSGGHQPDKVHEVLNFMLNAINKKVNGVVGNFFNCRTMPIIQLKGTTMFRLICGLCIDTVSSNYAYLNYNSPKTAGGLHMRLSNSFDASCHDVGT